MTLYFTVSSFLSRFVNLWVHSFFATTAEGESVAQRRGRPVISTNANTLQAVTSAWLLDDSISYLVIWDRCNGVSSLTQPIRSIDFEFDAPGTWVEWEAIRSERWAPLKHGTCQRNKQWTVSIRPHSTLLPMSWILPFSVSGILIPTTGSSLCFLRMHNLMTVRRTVISLDGCPAWHSGSKT